VIIIKNQFFYILENIILLLFIFFYTVPLRYTSCMPFVSKDEHVISTKNHTSRWDWVWGWVKNLKAI